MYRDLGDLDALLRSRLLVHSDLLHVVERFPPLQYLSKHGILPVQMRRCSERDEELRAIAVWTFICHAQYAPRVMPQGRSDLIFEQLVRRVVNGRGCFRFGVGRRAATLNHEIWYHSVEWTAIVCS